MPICKNCGDIFPNRIEINDKIHVLSSRKYCLKCSPFGLHNTKPIHKQELKDKHPCKCICSICGRHYTYGRKGHTKTKCNSCLVNEHRHKLKEKMIEYKGGECQKCGYSKAKSALQFHHINPNTKKFPISGSHCKSWKIIKEELDKCILLCANCHAELHEK